MSDTNDAIAVSFFGNAELKSEHVAQAEQHAAQDMLVSGTYGDTFNGKFRGCSVGCFAHDINPEVADDFHTVVAEARGLPEWLIRLQDSMFEGLPASERAGFHVELAKRIPVGVNLEPVQHWIAIARIDRMLTALTTSLEAKHGHGVHEAIEQVIAALAIGRRAHEAAAGGNSCDLSATESAAWSAASAAWLAAWLAARSAASAAWLAASAAWLAARSAAWIHERDALFSALDRVGGAS